MNKPNQGFDRRLFELKLRELSRKMQVQSVKCKNAAFANSALGGSPLIRLVDGEVVLLRDWLEGVDKAAREVWKIQGRMVTPEFVRGDLVREAMRLIAARKGVVSARLERHGRHRTRDLSTARHHLVWELGKLSAEVSERYEIEARTLEHATGDIRQSPPPGPSSVVELGLRIPERIKQEAEHSNRISPGENKTKITVESKPTVILPTTWDDLRKRSSVSQKEAAQFLECDPRTIRRRVKARELTSSRKGRIVCNEQLRNQIRKVHGEHVLR